MLRKNLFIFMIFILMLSGCIPDYQTELTSDSYILSVPAIGPDGIIYIGSNDGTLYAVLKDGNNKEIFKAGGAIQSSPSISHDGIIYFGSDDGNLYSINSDGSENWRFSTNGKIISSPAIGHNGNIYVGSTDNKIYSISAQGTKNWEYETGNWITSSPTISEDGYTIYIGSYDGKLYAIRQNELNETKTLWSFETNNYITSSPAIDTDGTIYIGSHDNNLYAINPDDGSEKWRFVTGYWIGSSPVIGAGGTIYVGSYDNNLYAINPIDGSEEWRFKTNGIIRSTPAIDVHGTIYIGSYDKNLYAIYTNSGTQKSSYNLEDWIASSPTIDNDGTIYIATYNNNEYDSIKGRLCSIETNCGGLADSPWPSFNFNSTNTGHKNYIEKRIEVEEIHKNGSNFESTLEKTKIIYLRNDNSEYIFNESPNIQLIDKSYYTTNEYKIRWIRWWWFWRPIFEQIETKYVKYQIKITDNNKITDINLSGYTNIINKNSIDNGYIYNIRCEKKYENILKTIQVIDCTYRCDFSGGGMSILEFR